MMEKNTSDSRGSAFPSSSVLMNCIKWARRIANSDECNHRFVKLLAINVWVRISRHWHVFRCNDHRPTELNGFVAFYSLRNELRFQKRIEFKLKYQIIDFVFGESDRTNALDQTMGWCIKQCWKTSDLFRFKEI